jgi:hypothetical protein
VKYISVDTTETFVDLGKNAENTGRDAGVHRIFLSCLMYDRYARNVNNLNSFVVNEPRSCRSAVEFSFNCNPERLSSMRQHGIYRADLLFFLNGHLPP